MSKPSIPSIRDLYPTLSDAELAEVEGNLDEYLTLVLRIFDRLQADAQANRLTPGTGTLPCTPFGTKEPQ